VATPSDTERITFIGHSLGGLLARYFVESPTRNGWRVMRRLITIGTPHLGVPDVFLHLTGRTFPFPENPFYRAAQDATLQQMAQAGVAPPGGFRAQLLPGRVQTDVFRFMASAIELLPVYDFVDNRGQREPFPTSYQALVHTGTGTPAVRLIQVLRDDLQKEGHLEQWLSSHSGRDYHFLAADGSPTVVGYQRGGDRIITRPLGDGRVPIRSALPVPASTAHVHLKRLTAGGFQHQRLCERADVQAYCLNVLRDGQRPQRGAGLRSIRGVTAPAPQLTDYVDMARAILAQRRVPARRGVVLSIARLEADSGPPLVDTATEPSNTPGRRRLSNPPAHLSSRDVFDVESPRLGTFRYVLIHSNEGEGGYPIGGFLFLPAPGERHIYLATFNVGPLDLRYGARCKNGHHAEIQLTRFVEHQPPAWRRTLRSIRIDNRSRSDRIGGYSPCNACCDDLATFLVALKALHGTPGVDATLSWLVRYRTSPICGHTTDHSGLTMLRTAGWKLPVEPPSTVREIAVGNRDLIAGGPRSERSAAW
jgi:Putative serine esterase (DUF676)